MKDQPMTLKETAKGVGIRAGILALGGLVIGGWLFGLAAKAASGIVKIFVGLILLVIAGGYATYEVKKFERRWMKPERDSAEL